MGGLGLPGGFEFKLGCVIWGKFPSPLCLSFLIL